MDAHQDYWRTFDDRGYPAVIAHSAGNARATAEGAIEQGADFIEIDLWLRKGKFEARHERRVGSLPVLFEKWYLALASKPFNLRMLAELVEDRSGIFLDFKTNSGASAATTAAVLAEVGGKAPVVASSPHWAVLRALHDVAPHIPLFYSIDVTARLDLFRSVVQHDFRPAGISCRGSLLTRPLVEEFQERGIRVVAWTIDDLPRAAELASWGVDGITTHLVDEMHALLAPVS